MEQLNAHETRALGVLIEKTLKTPEQGPPSLNGLMNGCNQILARLERQLAVLAEQLGEPLGE